MEIYCLFASLLCSLVCLDKDFVFQGIIKENAYNFYCKVFGLDEEAAHEELSYTIR